VRDESKVNSWVTRHSCWYIISLLLYCCCMAVAKGVCDDATTHSLHFKFLALQVFDERDPERGASMLMRENSVPWKDGLHYFRALEWRQVGQYRITFKLTQLRKEWADANVSITPLTFFVTVEDPEWEAEIRLKLEEEIELQLQREESEREKLLGYPMEPLTKREKYVVIHLKQLPCN
jgi:hypothetical protein